MTLTKLAGPIANYIAAANAQDIEGVAANFSDQAVVRDEGKTRQGIAAIREWAVEVSRKYRPSVEALEVAQSDGKSVVTGRVSGDFPGSPVDLDHRFLLDGDKIRRLEIG